MKTLNKLTLNDILTSGCNITFTYKKYIIVYHNGYITIYNSKKEYLNSYTLGIRNYTLANWKKIIKKSVDEK